LDVRLVSLNAEIAMLWPICALAWFGAVWSAAAGAYEVCRSLAVSTNHDVVKDIVKAIGSDGEDIIMNRPLRMFAQTCVTSAECNGNSRMFLNE
jgi:hypothetical protein